MPNGLSLRQAEKFGEYEVNSRNDSLQELTHLVVPDIAGHLQLRLHGDKVCSMYAATKQLLHSDSSLLGIPLSTMPLSFEMLVNCFALSRPL